MKNFSLSQIVNVFAVGLLLAVVVVGIWIFWPSSLFKPDAEPVTNLQNYDSYPYAPADLFNEFVSSVDEEEELSGEIYLTSIEKVPNFVEPIDSDGRLFDMDLFRFGLASDSFLDRKFTYLAWFPRLSKNGETVFVAQPSGWAEYDPHLFVVDAEGNTVRHDNKEYSDLSEQEVVDRRLPDWSPNGAYLYSVQVKNKGQSIPDSKDINSWKIFVREEGAEGPVYFADGYGAKWFDAGRYIIYVKEGGVYVKEYTAGNDHSLSEEMLIVSAYFPYKINNHIDVLEDTPYVAVAHPIHHDVRTSYVDIYKVSISAGEVSTERAVSIALPSNLYPMWPIFSPGGRYLSMQTYDPIATQDTNNHIKVFDIVNNGFVKEIELNEFYFDYSFNTDWVSSD